ncbi:MAG: hypothetical protein IJQ10_03965 [Clostridia bacterium]|nr:hypothetical protein [Clostridia bacterium]
MIKFFSKAIAFIFVFNSFAAGVKAVIPRAKIVILGVSRVGKTVLQKILGMSPWDYTHTTQLDMIEKEIKLSVIPKKTVLAYIWDTTPAMAYRQLIHDFSKTAHVAIVVLSGCICRYDENFEKEYEEFVSNLNSDCRIIFVITGEHSPIQMNKVMHFVKNILIGETLKKRTDGLYIFPDLSEDEVNKCRIEVNKMIETAIKNYGYEKLPENAQGMHGRIVERDVNKYVNNRYIMERKYELECY